MGMDILKLEGVLGQNWWDEKPLILRLRLGIAIFCRSWSRPGSWNLHWHRSMSFTACCISGFVNTHPVPTTPYKWPQNPPTATAQLESANTLDIATKIVDGVHMVKYTAVNRKKKLTNILRRPCFGIMSLHIFERLSTEHGSWGWQS